MTELEIVKMTRDLWDFLRKHPTAQKEHWEKYEVLGLADMNSECFCCEYYQDDAPLECPLNIDNIMDCYTNCAEGWFETWSTITSLAVKKESANRIYKILDKKYQKLLKKEDK